MIIPPPSKYSNDKRFGLSVILVSGTSKWRKIELAGIWINKSKGYNGYSWKNGEPVPAYPRINVFVLTKKGVLHLTFFSPRNVVVATRKSAATLLEETFDYRPSLESNMEKLALLLAELQINPDEASAMLRKKHIEAAAMLGDKSKYFKKPQPAEPPSKKSPPVEHSSKSTQKRDRISSPVTSLTPRKLSA